MLGWNTITSTDTLTFLRRAVSAGEYCAGVLDVARTSGRLHHPTAEKILDPNDTPCELLCGFFGSVTHGVYFVAVGCSCAISRCPRHVPDGAPFGS